MEMFFHSAAGNPGDAAICLHRRRNGDASVELAAAAVIRLAPGYLLASARTSCAVPDPLRWIWRARFRPPQFPPSHERALRERETGSAGTIPATHARPLGL